MPRCKGGNACGCPYCVAFDTYKGCSHGCKYCFVQKKTDLTNIRLGETPRVLMNWIEGKRDIDTKWVDWNIPLRWGCASDPFQPIELVQRNSLKCLEVFAETGYPFIVATKNVNIARPEYFKLIMKCNAVVQFSACAPEYDAMEPGASPFAERMKAAKKFADAGKRVVFRVQPYIWEFHKAIRAAIPAMAEAGAYGISLALLAKYWKGMKKGRGVRYGLEYLALCLEDLRGVCHKHGLKFLVGDLGAAAAGDELDCCGCEGLKEFRGNHFNTRYLMFGDEIPQPTPKMCEPGTGSRSIVCTQKTKSEKLLHSKSFAALMLMRTNSMLG